MKLKCIGVIGAGTMGCGVTQAIIESAMEVVLVDNNESQIKATLSLIEENARMYRLLHKDHSNNRSVSLADIETTNDINALVTVDFIIENITENWVLKKQLHCALNAVLPPDIPIAVNTSAIPMQKFAALYDNPGRIVGMHFMNPAPLMPLVEVIQHDKITASTKKLAVDLCQQLGKESIIVNDSPGFVTNRVMMLMVNEAIYLLHENVSTSADIDRLFKKCFNHRMGPLETTDLIGVDTVLYSLEVLQRELQDDKFQPCPLLREMVGNGYLGKKSGRGFYRYDNLPHYAS